MKNYSKISDKTAFFCSWSIVYRSRTGNFIPRKEFRLAPRVFDLEQFFQSQLFV